MIDATLTPIIAPLEARTAAQVSPLQSHPPPRRLVPRLWPLGTVLVALVVASTLLAWPK